MFGVQSLRQQGEVIAKAEVQLAEGVRLNRENIEEMQASAVSVLAESTWLDCTRSYYCTLGGANRPAF